VYHQYDFLNVYQEKQEQKISIFLSKFQLTVIVWNIIFLSCTN